MVKKEKRFFEIYIFFLIFFLVRVTNILLDKELNPKLGGDLLKEEDFFIF